MKQYYGVGALPDGYSLWDGFDMTRDKKILIWVNVLSLLLFLPFLPLLGILLMNTVLESGFFLLIIAGMPVLVVVHEGIHAIFFQRYGKGKVAFKFHGWAFSASMEGHFFSKAAYLVIGAAPVVILSLVLAAIGFFWPSGSVRFVAWFLFAIQFSSAAGDLYVLWRFRRLPQDALVEDTGTGMKAYSRTPRP